MNYTIENELLKVEVSSRGGELQSIVRDGGEYLWQADPAYWDEKAPNIFPYVARLTEGKYTLNGKEYHLPIHGFLPSTELVREEQSRDRIVFKLEANEETMKMYPYDFTYRLIYELDEDVLNVTYQVENHGEDTMYFGIGGHPGFAVPVGGSAEKEQLTFEDFYLEFSDPNGQVPSGEISARETAAGGAAQTPVRIAFSPTCFLTGEDKTYELENGNRIPLHHDMFDDDAIVLQNTPKTVTLKSDRAERYVRVSYPDMEYIGFWHAVRTDAPYICIEPWASLPSRQDVVEDLSTQPGLVSVAGGRKYVNRWSIEIH